MNADQKKQHRKELKARVAQRKIEKAQELSDLEDEEELDVLETAEESPVEKDMGMMPMDSYQVEPGPTSFAELDEMKASEEQADAVMEVTWQTRDLVGNILHSPDLDPTEKADAMKLVADEFAARVTTEIKNEQKDLDLLELEAIIAHDRRSMSAFEYVEDVAKRVLGSGGIDNLSDKAHVRNALARAAQMMKRGGSAASDARSALPKIHAAAKKMGIGSSTAKERNAILVQKDAKNDWRWVGWVSNNFVDWDGDIISEDAHKEYVEWWEKNKDLSPVSVSWHTPGTAREAPVDFMMYENGFLIASGILNEQEAAGLLKAQSKQDLGMSHGSFVFGRDAKDPRVITKYRMYEVSDLPLANAANPFTDFETLVKEVGMDNKLEYLTSIMGSEEKAKAFIEKTGMKKEALHAAGVESKEKVIDSNDPKPAPKPEPEPLPVPEPTPVPTVVTTIINAPTAEELVAQVMKEMDVPGLEAFVKSAQAAMDKVPVLEELVKSLQGTQEEKLAEVLTPPAARFSWSQKNRASQSTETVLKDDKKDGDLKKSLPGVPEEYWLSNITQTAPVIESK